MNQTKELARVKVPIVEAEEKDGLWIRFLPDEEPIFVQRNHWIGFDLDGTLSRTDNPGHFDPPYPIGEPIPEMLQVARALAGPPSRCRPSGSSGAGPVPSARPGRREPRLLPLAARCR